MVLGVLAVAGCGGSSGPSTRSSTPAPTSSSSSGATAPPAAAASGRVIGTGIVTGSVAGITATMRAGTHSPKVEQGWPIHVTVTANGRPAHASIGYEYLYAGAVVAHRSHYVFVGHFSDVLMWPSTAVGYPLTFRAVVTSGGVSIDLDYPVQVRQ